VSICPIQKFTCRNRITQSSSFTAKRFLRTLGGMKARVEAGTDIAQIGAWDIRRDDGAFDNLSFKRRTAALREDSEAGFIFVIHTGADGGGPIDVYLDEPIPENVLRTLEKHSGEFRLRVPTGQLVIGGGEDYRSLKPKITGPDSIISLPAGDYRLGCYVGKEEEYEGLSKSTLLNALGADDYGYWRRRDNTGCLGFLSLPLSFAITTYAFNWKIAIPMSVVIVILWFHCRDWILKRNARYQQIDSVVQELRRQAEAKAPPTFVFELKRLQDHSTLKGGEIYLC